MKSVSQARHDLVMYIGTHMAFSTRREFISRPDDFAIGLTAAINEFEDAVRDQERQILNNESH